MRALWLLVMCAGCLRTTEFRCETDTECGASGTCEAVGYCSFPDQSCGGHRFGDSAGPYSNDCVGGAGADGGIDDGKPIDAVLPAGCPAGYNELPGGSPHRYKVLAATDDWNAQRVLCNATSPTSAYLAIPDDDVELQALATLSGATELWVGISDLATENTFVTVRNQPATFLPWQPPAPDNDGPGEEDCVVAISALAKYNDDKCNTRFAAVCECEP